MFLNYKCNYAELRAQLVFFLNISVVQHSKFRKATGFVIAFASEEKKCI